MEIKVTTISSWKELIDKQRPYAIYRGQSDAGWQLSTSLERACIINDGNLASAKLREQRLLLLFKRYYHSFSPNSPGTEDALRWLAVMQHHGAPTRLMDWTYSIMVATYFAVENATTDSAVWEIDMKLLTNSAKNFLNRKEVNYQSLAVHKGYVSEDEAIKRFDDTILSNTLRLVRVTSPYYRDGRLTAQQGMFACPGDVSATFMENLIAMGSESDIIVKYIIPIALRPQMLYQLFVANIGRFSLFPGLDGFANTLRIFHPSVWDTDAGPKGLFPLEET